MCGRDAVSAVVTRAVWCCCLVGAALFGRPDKDQEWERARGEPSVPMPTNTGLAGQNAAPDSHKFWGRLAGFESLGSLDTTRYWRGPSMGRPRLEGLMRKGETVNEFIATGVACFVASGNKYVRCRADDFSPASLEQLRATVAELVAAAEEELADGPQIRAWHCGSSPNPSCEGRLVLCMLNRDRTTWGRFKGICYPKDGDVLLQTKAGGLVKKSLGYLSFADHLYVMAFEQHQQRLTAEEELPELVAAETEGLPKLMAAIRKASESTPSPLAGRRLADGWGFTPPPACSYRDMIPEYESALVVLEGIAGSTGVSVSREELAKELDIHLELSDPGNGLDMLIRSQRMARLQSVEKQEVPANERNTPPIGFYKIEVNGTATLAAAPPATYQEGMVCWQAIQMWRKRPVLHRMTWDADEERWCFVPKAEREEVDEMLRRGAEAAQAKFLEAIRQGKSGESASHMLRSGRAAPMVAMITPNLAYRRYTQFLRGMDLIGWPPEPVYERRMR